MLMRSIANGHLLFRDGAGGRRLCTTCCEPIKLRCGPEDVCNITKFMWVSLAGIESDCGCQDTETLDGEWFLAGLNGTYLLEADFFPNGLPGPEFCFAPACSYGFKTGCVEGSFGSAIVYESTDGSCDGFLAATDFVFLDIGICFPTVPAGDLIKAQVGISFVGAGEGEPDCDNLITVFEGESAYDGEDCNNLDREFSNDLTCGNSGGRVNGGSLFMWGDCNPELSATAWNSGTSYIPHNVVTDGGITYLSNTNNLNSVPASNPSDWVVI